MHGGSHSLGYEALAEIICTLLPRMEALGLTNAAEMDVDTAANRLRQEAVDTRGFCAGAILIGAFARRPWPDEQGEGAIYGN